MAFSGLLVTVHRGVVHRCADVKAMIVPHIHGICTSWAEIRPRGAGLRYAQEISNIRDQMVENNRNVDLGERP